jgi:hypothetical protein
MEKCVKLLIEGAFLGQLILLIGSKRENGLLGEQVSNPPPTPLC